MVPVGGEQYVASSTDFIFIGLVLTVDVIGSSCIEKIHAWGRGLDALNLLRNHNQEHCWTSGLNGLDQGTDCSPLLHIAYTLIDIKNLHKEEPVEEIDVKSLGLQASLQKVENSVPDDSILVTNGINGIRQVLHPLALRSSFKLSPLFCSFINVSRGEPLRPNSVRDGACSLDDELAAICERIRILIAREGDNVFKKVEEVRTELRNAICWKESEVDSAVVVRARGLPWQATDHDIAQFFVGLNIAPCVFASFLTHHRGGVALCLSAEGRRNGEALVRFEDSEQRELALKRHRHFLHNRYIEVYRAAGDEFLQVAAGGQLYMPPRFSGFFSGSNSEAVRFVSRGGAMIVRMRGLPYDCTETQIRDFFASGENGCKVMDGGVLFVNKGDGRPTGDAFVMFEDEATGQRALMKHKHTIGSRYIELFRSTQAEVQQVVNRNLENVHVTVQGNRKDCIRLRGLPYEAHVENIVEFLGDAARHIVFQGVHMVYNAQGHPSGEAFIQMDSEISAATAAAIAHNKYMQIGKKQRYIEVFQCSPEDMNLVITNPPLPPQLVLPPRPLYSQPANPAAAVTGMVPTLITPFTPVYWPYPSPPVSPNVYPLPSQPGLVLITGLCPNITPQDILAYFHSNPEIAAESVQMLRWGSAQCAGEALVRFRSRIDAERALAEHVGTQLGAAPINLSLIHT
ncbi:unnamed protein product [Anisakis simplex]|uniref:RRM domain-containing protein n=1 Tax=Anisakis simplex TaxID=6269 RepID=A0A3P6RMN1_ANISI|nr:unnamed protein product [Anisakis simplex]